MECLWESEEKEMLDILKFYWIRRSILFIGYGIYEVEYLRCILECCGINIVILGLGFILFELCRSRCYLFVGVKNKKFVEIIWRLYEILVIDGLLIIIFCFIDFWIGCW